MLGRGAHVRCVGKGRKERSTPLTKVAQQALWGWLNEPRKRGATALFPNTHGGKLSADGMQALLNKYVAKASRTLRHPPLEAGVAPCFEAQRCHGAAAGGRRLFGHRPMNGP